MMTKEELVNRLNKMEIGDGFDIENKDGIALGIRYFKILDNEVIVYGAYGGANNIIALNSYDSLGETADEIIDGFDGDYGMLGNLDECFINDDIEVF